MELEEYPFEKSKKSKEIRITKNFYINCSLPNNFKKVKEKHLKDFLLPHVWDAKNKAAVISGVSKSKWEDTYKVLLIIAKENNAKYILFVWDENTHYCISIKNKDWKDYFPDKDHYKKEIKRYNIGYHINFSNTVRESLESCCIIKKPVQLFVSPPNNKFSSNQSMTIPNFNSNNNPSLDVIIEKQLIVFCHASLMMNLANGGYEDYISKLLSYCTSNGIIGAVFHVGKSTNYSVKDSLKNMKRCIVNGIKKTKGNIITKFLLETPAGQGNDLLTTFEDFSNFALDIKSKLGNDYKHLFGVCVDTCHVFACGYCPYSYLREIYSKVGSKYINLIHFNDSLNNWNSRVDRHANFGKGKIPIPLLFKVAQFSSENNISCLYESYSIFG